jgi:hypothetical protein
MAMHQWPVVCLAFWMRPAPTIVQGFRGIHGTIRWVEFIQGSKKFRDFVSRETIEDE